MSPSGMGAPRLQVMDLQFLEHYNHHLYHESLNNVTPADVFFGRHQNILSRRERTKQRTLAQRRIANLRTGVV